MARMAATGSFEFPFLFGRAFIEAQLAGATKAEAQKFPFLFGRAFIEAGQWDTTRSKNSNFPSFLEGLSLRQGTG